MDPIMSENLANCGNTNDPSPTPFERNENILPNGFAFPNDINKATMKKYLKFDENPTKEIRILKPLTLEEETLSNISVQGSDNQEDEELSSSIFKSFDERNSNNYLGFRRISKLETKEQKNERMYKEFLRWKVFADVFEYNGKISLFESDKSELSLSEYYYDNYEEPLVIGDYQYKGFLYRLTIWQTAITQIPNQFDICSNGQSVTSCLWSCDSNNYYNEITDACENCDSSCTSGCSTFGTCNQCSSSFCQTCSDFNATCAESTSYNSCLGEGKCCHAKCEKCFGELSTNCLECKSGYFLLGDNCVDSCPVGFSQYLANCVVSVNPFFDITFNSLTSEYKDTASNIVFTYSSNITPVMQRGIYFNSMATLSTDSLMFSYNFTIVLYVKIVASGNILAFNGFTISENSGIEIKISGNLLCAFTSLNPQNWMLLKISQWKDIKQLQYSQSINLQEKSTSTDCVSENSIYSAAIDQLSLGSKFFNGFIWKLQIFSSVTDINPPSLIVCATSLEANCVWDCDLNSYLSSDSCEYCDINCETCRRASDCSLCVNELCITCTDYETCGSCASDSSLNDLSVCKCNNGLYWESLENSCKPCYFTCMNCDGPSENDCVCKYGVLVNDICECDKGYFSISNGCKICDERCDQCDGIYYYNCLSCKGYLLDNVCLDYCPMGYITAFHQCELINDGGIALKYQFDSMAKNQTGAYEYLNFFNVISTYQRGICFNHSHLELPHSASPILVFGVKFAIELWINPLNLTSAVFFKNNTFQTIFSVSLSNGYQNIIINIDNEPYEYTSWYPVHQKEWNHILIILDSTKGTTLQTFTNTYSTQAMCIEECFYDDINSFLYVGTDFNTEDYSGFMYSFAIYLKWPQIYQLATLENCDFCSVCNSTLTCTPNCNILAYYNSTILKCVDCRTECTYGCRNGINCSLCIDENCIKCESYGTKSCVECESGYEVIENICVQCNSSSYYNYDLKICKMCEGVCKTCSSKVCKSCGKNSYLTKENICECESGYFINNSDCSRKKFYASASINSKNIIKILFSEDLSSPLKHSEISAKINAISQDFDLEKKNNSTYTLSIIFTKSIEKGDKLKMTFAKPLTSKENSILFTKFLELELFPLPSDTIGAEISNAKSYATAGIMAGVSAALGSSFINIDPSSFFSLLNNIEIFTYFTLYQLEISPTLIGFLNTLNPISLIPNIFTYIISPSQGVSLNDKFINVSVTSNLILLNSGATISILIAFLLIPFCALCIRDTQISGLKYELKKL